LKNLVTGGAGFIGSNLINKLMQKGEKVICVDNFSTGNVENIKRWKNNSRFELIKEDILNPIKNIKVDRIWHLACPASPKYYLINPIETAKINFQGTLNMLKLARKLDAKFLLASTSEIYGNCETNPQDENYRGSVNTQGIRSCYKEGKRIAETLCFDYYLQFKTEVSIARIFNTYGPLLQKNDGRVISNFINQCLSNQPITINGNGNQKRCFCYVSDIISGLIKLMDSSYRFPINLGNPKEEFTIYEIAQKIKSKINYKTDLKYYPAKEDEPMLRKPNIQLAKTLLNWEPNINIDEGLNKTINFFKDHFY
tara:strand:- start:4842 stop:5774 length:933 start_codon:yes stop_codon:yes gene_type:complete